MFIRELEDATKTKEIEKITLYFLKDIRKLKNKNLSSKKKLKKLKK